MAGINAQGGGMGGGGTVNPSAATHNPDDYIRSLLDMGKSNNDAGGDTFSLSSGAGSAAPQKELSTFWKVVVGSLAAFGAWKAGGGAILKSIYNNTVRRGQGEQILKEQLKHHQDKAARQLKKAGKVEEKIAKAATKAEEAAAKTATNAAETVSDIATPV